MGCGRWGASLANAVSTMPEFALSWVCDPAVRPIEVRWAPALTEQVCLEVDAVIVATPPEHHLTPTLTALRVGKPVLVEKPFLQSLAEVRQVRAVRGTTPVMVGHLLAYHPGYQALMEWVKTSATTVYVEVVRHSPARGDGRCPWWTLAPHDLALLTRLFGEPQDLRLATAGDAVQAQLTWPGTRATLSYCTTATGKCRYWRVKSGIGELVFDELSGVLSKSGETRDCASFADADPLRTELKHFASCVRSHADALTGIDEGEQSVRLLCWGDQQLRLSRRGRGYDRGAREALRNP